MGNVLVSAQVAVSTVLLISTVLLTATFTNLRRVSPGFDAQHVVMFSLDLRAGGYGPENSSIFIRELLDRVRGILGVQTAAIVRPRLFSVPSRSQHKSLETLISVH